MAAENAFSMDALSALEMRGVTDLRESNFFDCSSTCKEVRSTGFVPFFYSNLSASRHASWYLSL